MKQKIGFLFLCSLLSTGVFSQSIVVMSGSIDCLLAESVIDFTFSYEDMRVGKMTEREYVEKKVEDYNKKKEERGDQWKQSWIGDREKRFEPKFKELFTKYMEKEGIVAGTEGANYRMNINTDFTEPGFNVGVVRKNASVDLTCQVIDVHTGEKVATVMMRDVSANNFSGTDFDTGFRIQECYAKAGREFAKYLIKMKKKKKK